MEYLVSIFLGKSRERRETTYIGAVIPVHDLSWRPWKLSAAFLLTNSCCKRLLGGLFGWIYWDNLIRLTQFLGWFGPSKFKIELGRVGFNPKMIHCIYLGVPENFFADFLLTNNCGKRLLGGIWFNLVWPNRTWFKKFFILR